MKIETKRTIKALRNSLTFGAFALFGGLTVLSYPAFAQTAAGAALPQIASPKMIPPQTASAPSMPVAIPANASTAVASPDIKQAAPIGVAGVGGTPLSQTSSSISLPPPNESNDTAAAPDSNPQPNEKKTEKSLSKLEDKVNNSAKDVVSRLGSSSTELTLDDLNAAKIAVAKIDALIDIEKHLSDLDKIRDERKKSSSQAIPQIPLSAIQPPSLPMPMVLRQPPPVSDESVPYTPPVIKENAVDVSQILGTEGHYAAILSLSGGTTKTVRIGDKLSDGSVITGITANGVTLSQQGKTHAFSVKGVDKVYGRTF